MGVWVHCVGFVAWGVGCGVWGVGRGAWGVGCGVWGVGCGVWRTNSVAPRRLADYSQVDVLGFRYKFVNFGADNSQNAGKWWSEKDLQHPFDAANGFGFLRAVGLLLGRPLHVDLRLRFDLTQSVPKVDL